MADILQITLPDGTTYDLKDSTAVTNVGWDSTNWKIQKTINGTTSDVVTLPLISGTGTDSAVGGRKTSGSACVASGNYSFAFGSGAQATNTGSIAFNTISRGVGSFSVGTKLTGKNNTEASGFGAIAMGASCYASGAYATSIGYNCNAQNNLSICLGSMADASGAQAISIGTGTEASSTTQIALGRFNIEDDQNDYLLILGNGTADNARSNALTIDWSGNQALAGSITLGYGGNDATTLTAAQLKTLISTGTTGQVLTKTASGFEWALLPNANGVSF